MNWKTLALVTLLVGFSIVSAYAILEVGYIGLFEAGLANWGTAQILLDLMVACLLLMTWMIADARRNGISPWPYVFITVIGGSFGPLLYLLRREWPRRIATSAHAS